MPVNPALRKLRQEDQEFKATLGNLVRPCLKIQKGWGCGSVVECLPSICETIDWISSTTNKQNQFEVRSDI
jgi:hypothetical protein